MTDRVKPLLLLDIDGVLMPAGKTPPVRFETVELNGYQLVVSKQHSQWLQRLMDSYELVWATTWGEQANVSVGPALGLPNLEVMDIKKNRTAATQKLASITEWVGDRDLAWVDDELFEDAESWAQARDARTLLIRTSSYVALTEQHFDQLLQFADDTRS